MLFLATKSLHQMLTILWSLEQQWWVMMVFIIFWSMFWLDRSGWTAGCHTCKRCSAIGWLKWALRRCDAGCFPTGRFEALTRPVLDSIVKLYWITGDIYDHDNIWYRDLVDTSKSAHINTYIYMYYIFISYMVRWKIYSQGWRRVDIVVYAR